MSVITLKKKRIFKYKTIIKCESRKYGLRPPDPGHLSGAVLK